jgi:hypothetical protein
MMHSTPDEGDHVNPEGSVAQLVATATHDLDARLVGLGWQ